MKKNEKNLTALQKELSKKNLLKKSAGKKLKGGAGAGDPPPFGEHRGG